MAINRRTETRIYLVVLMAIVVGINVLSFGCGPNHRVRTREDTTRTQRSTHSEDRPPSASQAGVGDRTRRLLSTLKQPVELEAHVTRGLPALDAFVDDLDDLLMEYVRAGHGKFRYARVEVKTDEQRVAAKEAGLKEATFGEATGDNQASLKQGFMGLAFKYRGEKEVIPILSPKRTDGLEYWITNKIREVRDKADGISHRIGVISGKDELKLSEPNLIAKTGKGGPAIQSIMQQACPYYKLENVDLKDGEAEIDKAMVGLIITQPGKDFTDKELRRIDQFVMRGRSLLVVAGAANLKASDATMKASLNLHRLDKLLTGYGIEMGKNVAMDWSRLMRIPMVTQSGNVLWVYLPGISQPQYIPGLEDDQQMLDSEFAGFFRLEEIALPYPSTLTLHPDKQPEAKMFVVARTGPRTTIAKGKSVELAPSTDFNPQPPFEQHCVAAVVEGKLKRAMPTPKESDGIEIPEWVAGDARVFVIPTGLFLSNPYAHAGRAPDVDPRPAMVGNGGDDDLLQAISQPYAQKFLTTSILAFKNALDWMTYSDI
jgi:gliding motility-associatede transport system auxiliary component